MNFVGDSVLVPAYDPSAQDILNLLEISYSDRFSNDTNNKEKLSRKTGKTISEIMANSITNSFLNY